MASAGQMKNQIGAPQLPREHSIAMHTRAHCPKLLLLVKREVIVLIRWRVQWRATHTPRKSRRTLSLDDCFNFVAMLECARLCPLPSTRV